MARNCLYLGTMYQTHTAWAVPSGMMRCQSGCRLTTGVFITTLSTHLGCIQLNPFNPTRVWSLWTHTPCIMQDTCRQSYTTVYPYRALSRFLLPVSCRTRADSLITQCIPTEPCLDSYALYHAGHVQTVLYHSVSLQSPV